MHRMIRNFFDPFILSLTKKTIRQKNYKALRALTLVGFSGFFITACVPGLEGLFPSVFTVEYPAEYNPEKPVILNKEATAKDAKPIKIVYPKGTKIPLNVYFNGQNFSSCFTFTPTEATAALDCMRDYFRQGKNTLLVNPQSLFNSAIRIFMLDTEGSRPSITKVCFTSGENCSQASTGEVDVTVEYIDPSPIKSATLNGSTSSIDGKKHTFSVPVSDTYTFTTTDANDYTATHVYKADGQRIDEVANIRVAEDMLGEFLPLINEQASGMESGNADGSGDPVLENLTIDIIGIKIAASVLYIKVGKMNMKALAIGDTSPYPLTMDMFMDPLESGWEDNDGNANSENVGIEVLLNMHDYTECWGATCGFLGLFTEAIPCPIVGWDRCNYGITVKDMRMRMYIERIQVQSAIDLNVNQGKFDIKLNKLDGKDVITMHDVIPSLDGGEVGDGASSTGIMGAIIKSPMLRGLIKGIVEDTINRNMEELKLGKSFDFDTGAQMDFFGKVESMDTNGGDGDNIGNLTVEMSAALTTVIPDKTIPPALGSYYVNDKPALAKPADEGSSLGVVVNSNMINQGLLAMYNTGATHLAMLNGEMHTGSGVTDDMGKDNDIRVVLAPSSPGEFFIDGQDTDQAYISFRGAEMTVSYKKNGTWSPLAQINIDIKAGVTLGVADGFVTMTIAGTPEYTINHMSDLIFGGGGIDVFINTGVIKGLVKVFIEWGVPFLADTLLQIDVSKAGISDKLYTESVNNNAGHLNFETSVDKTP